MFFAIKTPRQNGGVFLFALILLPSTIVDMNTQTRIYTAFIIGIVILAGLGWLAYTQWQNYFGPAPESIGGFTVMKNKQPSFLDREIKFPENFPEDARSIITEKIQGFRTSLEANPADYPAWLDLAIQYKTLEDYEGAREVWEYINIAAPAQTVSFLNLGDLYTGYLKDYEKAEENYLQAIKNSPDQGIAYIGLSELYRYSYKTDTNAAEDILKRGIEAIPSPNNVDVIIALASYYKAEGRKAEALEQYNAAIEAAKALNNPSLEQQLKTEASAL